MNFRLKGLFFLIPMILLVSCSSNRTYEDGASMDKHSTEFTTIARGTLQNPMPGSYNLDSDKVQVHKITSSEQWDAYLDQAMPARDERQPPATPDFENGIVLALTAGQKPSSGYDIRIHNIDFEDDTIIVSATETVPGKNCMLMMMLTWPYHYVQVTRDAAGFSVELERTEFTQDC